VGKFVLAKNCFLRFLLAYRSWNKWGIEDESTLFEMKHYDDSLTMAAVKIGADVAGHEPVTKLRSFARLHPWSYWKVVGRRQLQVHVICCNHFAALVRHIRNHGIPWPYSV
jgi:hypothetical protein